MPLVSNINSLRAGIQKDLAETWRQQWPVYEALQKAFLHYLPWINIRNAEYGFKERIPMPKPWPYGKGRSYQMFKDRKLTIGLFPYELTVPYSERDSSDDQLGDMKTHLGQIVGRFLQLPDIMITEYMTGTASYNYNGLVLAYDGVNLYSTTDGDGAARFGVTGGNIRPGSGVSTNAQVIDDIIGVRRQFLEMLEPVTNQPLHDPNKVTYNNMIFIVPTELDGIFRAIQKQQTIYSDASINTAQSNQFVGEIVYHVNQRLTDANDWFVVLQHDYWKPFAYRAPQNVRQILAEMNNSDHAREFAEETMYADLRLGIGPWAPFTTIKVSNS